MKKKLLALVLAACMLCGFSTTAFAETTVYGDGDASIPVTYHKDSSYSISIPESIDLNGNSITFSCYKNITDNEIIDVTLDSNDINLQSTSGGQSTHGNLTKPTGELMPTDIPVIQFINGETCIKTLEYSFNAQDANAGDYTGTMTFHFSLRNL